MERTLILVKPDAMQRGLAGEILTRLEARGLRLIGLKLLQMTEDLANQHYAEHVGKGFFAGLVSYMTSGPIVAAVFEGPDAVKAVRQSVGATNPVEAAPGTIRGDYGLLKGRNLVHASDGPEAAARELKQEAARAVASAKRVAQQSQTALKKAATHAKETEETMVAAEERLQKIASVAHEARQQARRAAVEAESAAQAVEEAERALERATRALADLEGS